MISGADSQEFPVGQKSEPENSHSFLGFPKQKIAVLVGDYVCVALVAIPLLMRHASLSGDLPLLAVTMITYLVCYPSALYVFDMYNIQRCFRAVDVFKRCLLAALLGGVFSTLLSFSLEEPPLDVTKAIEVVALWAFFTTWRRLYSTLYQTWVGKKTVLIIGMGDSGKAMADVLSMPPSPYVVTGFVDESAEPVESEGQQKITEISGRFREAASAFDVSSAILAIPGDCSPQLRRRIVEARMNGTVIEEMTDVYERLTGRVPLRFIHDDWFLSVSGFRIFSKSYVRHVKRAIDIGASVLLLVAASPLILLVALAVRSESAGPVFYRQDRVGLRGKVFGLYKFRSMVADAERNGVQWATSNDPRITRVGKWLRLYRLDELPQLWNVLKGDMSLVGPRPERPEFVRKLEQALPYYHIRHYVEPGLTGWAQVTFRYGASVEDALNKLEADIYYLKNMSITLDLKILLKTIGVVFLAQGAR